MTHSAENDAALHPCAVRCQHAAALGAPEWASCADGVDRCSYYGGIPPAACACGHPSDDHDDEGACMHLCDCAWPSAENDALAGEVWQEADNVLLLCVEPGVQWQDFNGHRFPWDAPTVARPLRRLLDRAGNLAPEYGKTRPIPPGESDG